MSTTEESYIVVNEAYNGSMLSSAFKLDENGELLESELVDGQPDFSDAGMCDMYRGSNPKLQAALRLALTAMAAGEDTSHDAIATAQATLRAAGDLGWPTR